MAKAYITRRAQFCIAHRVYNPQWDDKKNFEMFGKCSYPNYHGHNLTLEVTVVGPVDKETGFVMNLTRLKEIINRVIVEPMDHRNLNLDVPFMKGVIPSMENLIIKIWEQLQPHIPPPAKLYKLKLIETDNNIIEYYGD